MVTTVGRNGGHINTGHDLRSSTLWPQFAARRSDQNTARVASAPNLHVVFTDSHLVRGTLEPERDQPGGAGIRAIEPPL